MSRLAMLVDRILDHLANPRLHLLTQVDALEHTAPLAVDDLALLVHDIVVLDEVTAGGEVVPPDRGLRPLPLPRDQARLDRFVARPPQPARPAFDPPAPED